MKINCFENFNISRNGSNANDNFSNGATGRTRYWSGGRDDPFSSLLLSLPLLQSLCLPQVQALLQQWIPKHSPSLLVNHWECLALGPVTGPDSVTICLVLHYLRDNKLYKITLCISCADTEHSSKTYVSSVVWVWLSKQVERHQLKDLTPEAHSTASHSVQDHKAAISHPEP